MAGWEFNASPTQNSVVLYQNLWQDPRDSCMNDEHLAFCNFEFRSDVAIDFAYFRGFEDPHSLQSMSYIISIARSLFWNFWPLAATNWVISFRPFYLFLCVFHSLSNAVDKFAAPLD